jgi:hypothetical protein
MVELNEKRAEGCPDSSRFQPERFRPSGVSFGE